MPKDDWKNGSWQEEVLEIIENNGTPWLIEEAAKVWVVKSDSDPMGFYYVLGFPWGPVCTCDGFRYRAKCKHLALVVDTSTEGVVDSNEEEEADANSE